MIKFIILHHSALNSLEFEPQFDIINNGHKRKNWGDKQNPVYAKKSQLGYYIQYHYFIESSGIIKMGRKENEIGWHCGNWEANKSSISICLAGNFDQELPTEEQKKSLTKLLKELKLKYPKAEIKGHRDFVATHCPGLKIADDWANNLINNNNKMKLIGNNKTKNQFAVGNDGVKHKLSNLAMLEDLHNAGMVDKNSVEWKDEIDGIIGREWGSLCSDR